MDAERLRILNNARDTIQEIDQIFLDCDHWNRTHPDAEPVDCDPDGKLRLMSEALKDMVARDEAKGHVGLIEAPLMALVIQKGPKAIQ